MATDPETKKTKPLVTVEFQNEIDLATGERAKRMFVKMYFEARDSGLLAAIPDEEWKTLCALATYMDENGYCYPSQAEIARVLGIGRQAANRRIQRLKEFRFQDRPVLALEKTRTHSAKGPTRWANNVYRIYPISGFNFGDGKPSQQETPQKPSNFSMSPQRDTDVSVSPVADIAGRDTNKNQVTNKKHTRVSFSDKKKKLDPPALVAEFHQLCNHPESQKPLKKELTQAAELLDQHGPDAAHYAVRFALDRGSETHFQMRHFGAVLSYVPEALADLQRRQQQRAQEQQDRRRKAREQAEIEAERAAWQELTSEERVERRLDRRLTVFASLHRREPTAREREAIRQKLIKEEIPETTTVTPRSASRVT